MRYNLTMEYLRAESCKIKTRSTHLKIQNPSPSFFIIRRNDSVYQALTLENSLNNLFNWSWITNTILRKSQKLGGVNPKLAVASNLYNSFPSATPFPWCEYLITVFPEAKLEVFPYVGRLARSQIRRWTNHKFPLLFFAWRQLSFPVLLLYKAPKRCPP